VPKPKASVAEVLAAYEGQSRRELIDGLLKKRGWTKMQFITAVYGSVSNASVYNFLKGKTITRATAERWGKVLKVPADTFPWGHRGHGPGAKRAAVLPEVEKGPDQFALTIDSEGRATLILNLINVPVDTALRAIAALTSEGVLNVKGIPHERDQRVEPAGQVAIGTGRVASRDPRGGHAGRAGDA